VRPTNSLPLVLVDSLLYSGTGGIGKESVVQIAKHNPRALYFTGRNAKNATAVIERVRQAAPSVKITFLENDLSSLDSVKTVAGKFLAQEDRLDVLLCNAGLAMSPAALTKDGYELLFGTNHVGHALLIKKLLPLLQRTAAEPHSDVRIVAVSSKMVDTTPAGGIDFSTLQSGEEIGWFGSFKRYGQSKLANTIYASELARRYPEITSVSLHPGVVDTPMNQKQGWFMHKLSGLFGPGGRYLTQEQGAYNSLWASFSPKEKIVNGQMYDLVGRPFMKLPQVAKDESLSKKLWEWTQKELEKH
jgi:NAD(P)-dependent dehydrogenase (short-subunit alcohol dehydrogenase family)